MSMHHTFVEESLILFFVRLSHYIVIAIFPSAMHENGFIQKHKKRDTMIVIYSPLPKKRRTSVSKGTCLCRIYTIFYVCINCVYLSIMMC